MRLALMTVLLFIASLAQAGERQQIVTTEGGVSRIAVERPATSQLTLPTSARRQPSASRNPATRIRAHHDQRIVPVRANLAADIAGSAANTAYRTTRSTLRREINREIRWQLRNAIQF